MGEKSCPIPRPCFLRPDCTTPSSVCILPLFPHSRAHLGSPRLETFSYPHALYLSPISGLMTPPAGPRVMAVPRRSHTPMPFTSLPLPLPRADDSSSWAPLDGSPGTLPPGLSLTCAIAADAGPPGDGGGGGSGAKDGGEPDGGPADPSRGGSPSADDQEGGSSGRTSGLSGENRVSLARKTECLCIHTPSILLPSSHPSQPGFQMIWP